MFISTFNRKVGKALSLLTLFFLIAVHTYGQIGVTVTGNTNTTPNLLASYPNFTAAVADLNLVTAMSGPVTFTLAAGTSETAPVKGFNISTATAGLLSATNTLTIVKAVGAATVINAGVGTAATANVANPDGMMYLSGSDYVTIDGLTFTDGNSASATVAMEFGIALFKRSAGDGCNNNTIQNCIFNMQRINNSVSGGPMGEGANAIEIVNSTAAAANVALTPTNGGTLATNGTNSNNRIYSNSINGGNAGIHLGGFAAASGVGPAPTATTFLGDLNNDIGGTSVGTGNTILNYGGGAAVQAAVGIRANNQWSVNIRYNTIDNNNGSGVNHATTLRGIYAQAGTSAAATISNNTVTVRSGATTSALTAIDNGIGSTAAANTVDINSNTIRFSYTTATTGVFTAVNNSASAAAVNINSNNIQQLAATNYPTTGTIPVIVGGSPGGTLNINNNTISNFNMTSATGGTLRAITASTPTGLYTCTGNTIENLSYSTAGSTGSITGIYNLASATQENWNNNIIRNFSTPGTGTLNGIQNNTVTGTFQCNNNQIYNFSTSAGGAGGFTANGITWSNATVTISGNIIYSINSTGSTGGSGGTINGITHSGAATVTGNAIYDLSSNSTNVVINGITVAATGNNTVTNNLVGDLRAPNSTGNISISGILVSGGTNNNIFHNTVNIAATTSSATTFGTSAIYFSSAAPVNNVRNNIFVNTSASGPTGGYAAAIRYLSAPTSTNFPAANNNNLYYAGAPSATKLIYGETSTATPTNPQQTIAAYKTYISTTLPVAGREGSSVSENPGFVSTTGSNPITNFLRYNTGTALQLEQGGVTGTGVSVDYAGTTRCPGGGCPGGATTPDMGAWELNGTPSDVSGPTISYTALANSGCTGSVSLVATITDASNVNGTLGTRPRLYYKKSTDANTYAGNTSGDNGWKYVEATGATSPFTFNLNPALLQAAIASGDVIQYFVVAQDQAAIPNVGINAGTFTAAPSSVALAAGAFPVSGFNSYTILNGLPTVINIPADYPTLTVAGGLFAAINAGSLIGNTVVNINANVTTETGAITLNQIAYGCAGPYTLTIKPTGGARTLSGTAAGAGLIKLNGADNVIIDGSTSGGTDRSLTITNNGTTTGTTPVSIISLGLGAGATANTVKNCNLSAGSISVATYGISVGGATSGTAGADNDNNTIDNNNITNVAIGVYANGTTNVSAGGIDNLVVSGNAINTGIAGVGAFGIRVGNAQTASITQNTIDVRQSVSNAPVGISAEAGFLNSSITRNQITRSFYTGTGGYGGRGIVIGTGSAASNVTVSNNFVAGVNGDNWSSFGGASSMGIAIGVDGNTSTLTTTTGGVNLYYNSVHMAGTYARGTTAVVTTALYIGSNASALNVRNNIFSNSLQNTSGTAGACSNYGIYSAAAATAFTVLNYNNYFGATTANNTFYVGYLGSNQSTLANWQTAVTPREANGINLDPEFQSSTDLHISPSSTNMNNVGTNIAGLTIDIDGDTRNVTTPDIGADEYTPCTPPSVSITPSSAQVCNPNPSAITLTAVGTGVRSWYNGTPGVYTGIWRNAALSTPYTGQDDAVVYVGTAATYSLRLDFAGCFDIATQTITSKTGITLPALTNNGPICPGSSAVITSNATLPVTASAYSWSSGTGQPLYTITSPTVVTTVSTGSVDDGQIAITPAPAFTFPYTGTDYTAFSAGTNGYVTIGGTSTAIPSSLTSLSGLNVVFAFGRDGNLNDVNSGNVTHGPAAGGLYVFQYNLTSGASGGGTSAAITATYQIVLWGSGSAAPGRIQIVYGSSLGTPATAGTIGIKDIANTYVNGINGLNNSLVTAAAWPASGTIYTFEPPPSGLTYAWVASGPPADNADFDDQTIASPTVGPLGVNGNYPYQLTVTAANGCQAVRTTTVVVQTTALVVNPPTTNNNNFCYGGTATLTMTNRFSGGCPSYTYYLNASPGGLITSGTVSGPGVPNTFVVTPTNANTDYTLRIVDDNGTDITSAPLTITITNPQPLTSSAATRCGVGTTQLTGTVNGGDQLVWYTAPTGGTYLGAGSPVTSPQISSTTTFYAAAVTGGALTNMGPASPAAQGGTIGTQTVQWNINFTTLVPTILQSVTVYPLTSGNPGVIELRQGSSSSGTLLATVNYTSSVSGGATPQIVPLNFTISTPGSYNLYTPTIPAGGFSRNTSGQTYPVSSAVANITGNGFDNTYWMGLYNWTFLTGCEGVRVPVVATVNPPPALAVTANQVVCNNTVATLAVTTGGASFNNYIWSPTTNLFTDAACTIPYTGTSALTVYAKSTTAGSTTYTMTATQTGGAQCVNTATTTLTIQPNPTSVNPSLANICISGSVTMTLTPSSGYAPGTLQWQTGATIPALADIGGANASSYTTPVISSGSPFYRIIVKNGLGATCTQFTIPFNVNNPQVLTSNGATRCGQGSVNLTATVNGGSTVAWYDAPTGGNQVGAISPFPTPTITGTTTYYVSAVGSPYSFNLGLPDNSAGTYSASTASDWPIRFTTTKATKIKTVVVYPSVAGNLYVALRASASSTDIVNVGPITLQAADIGNPVVLNLDISIPTPGDYQLTGLSTGPGRIGRISSVSGTPYPFLSPDGSVTVYGSATSSATAIGSFSTTTYNSFFNIQFESACESNRVPVVATVTPAPALNPPVASPSTICAGDPTILSISSGNAGYTYTWLPGNVTGSNQTFSPGSTTVYTVNALDNSGGPNNGCFNTAQIQVNVNPVPSAAVVNMTPATAVCGGTVKTLAATANTSATYSFGVQASLNTASTTVAGYPGPYTVYYGGQRMQMLIRASELQANGFVTGSQLTSIGFTVATIGTNNPSNLNFQMNIGHTALNALAANGFQGGLTNVVPIGTYTATVGLNTHTFSSPFIWNGVDNIVLETTFSNAITGGTNDLIASYYSPTSFTSTIVYRVDGVAAATVAAATNTTYTYAARPDFVLNGNLGATSITWTPAANLFTDAGATIAYVANANAPTVYAKMDNTTSVNTRVTLSATGCKTDLPISVLYTPRPTVDISANEFVCQGQDAPVNFFFTGTGPWDMNYTINGVAQAPLTGVVTSPVNIPYTNASVTRNYVVTSLTDASCAGSGADLGTRSITVPVPCEIVWNGSQSNDWSDANNWTPNNSAPSQYTSVKVPSNVINQPLITGNSFAANVNFIGTPVPTIGAGGVLNIKGNVAAGGVTGTTILGDGKVAINGTGLQTITGKFTVPNLDLGNTSAQGVVISPSAILRVNPVAASNSGLVTLLNNSRLTINGDFVLGSNALGTAKIGPVPATFTLTGQPTIERWLPYTTLTGGSWYFLGSPFSGKNFTDLVDNFKVVGLNSGFGVQGSGIINSNEPERSTIFKYVETTHDTRLDTVQKQGWRIPGNENIIPGNGYRVWVDYYSNGTHKFDTKGNFVFGDFNFPTLTRREQGPCNPVTFPCDEASLRGWNLLANPYPCDIDWDAAGSSWTKPIELSNGWYRWHASANNYGLYAGGLYSGTTPAPANPQLIPSNQAFFVRLAIGGSYDRTLSVKESAKVTAISGQFLKTAVADEKLRINISQPGNIYGYDAIIRFMDGATDGYDFNKDFHALTGPNFSITIPVESDQMTIAAFGPVTEYKVIPLNVKYNNIYGVFQLKFSQLNSILEHNQVFLRDNLLSTMVPVTEGFVYSYTASSQDVIQSGRFELIFNPEAVTATVKAETASLAMTLYPNPNLSGKVTTIALVGFEGHNASIHITDAMGRLVFKTQVAIHAEGVTEYQLAEPLAAGIYTVKTSDGKHNLIQKLVVK